jgi:hypothetical protein
MCKWVRFAERRPAPGDPKELLCVHAGRRPFMYHWFIDRDGHTEDDDFFWLEGMRLPPIPDSQPNGRRYVADSPKRNGGPP